MRCPFCGNTEDRVVDSRESREGDVIRRRRECVSCERRFTSYEKIELEPFQDVKRDQRREPYEREKMMGGLRIACRKRPISEETLLRIADSIEAEMQESGEREISSRELGGEPGDVRAQQAARKRGYDIGEFRARQISQDDFRDFDLILAMDWENLSLLQQQCSRGHKHKLHLLMRFAGEFDAATVPDPYYGGPEGFGTVLDYVEDACQGLLEVVRKRATMYAAA